MIFAIELLLEAFLIYKVWTERDRTRLFLWFMSAMILLFPGLKLVQGTPAVNWMFPVVCLLRVIKEKGLKECWKKFPLKYIYGAILLFHFLQPLFSKWQGFGSTYFYVIQYVMTTYLYLFLGYCMAPDYSKLLENKKWIYTWLTIIFGIAVICKILTYNIISSNLSDVSIWASERAFTDRGFRVTSTQGSPNIFGYVNVLLAIFILNFREKNRIKCIMFALILINLILCGTRAPMVGLAATLCAYAIFVNKAKLIRTVLLGVLAIIIASNFVSNDSPAMKYVNGVVDIFATGGENTGGSSVDLRERQLAVATSFAVNNPIWGCGNGFCNAMQNETSNQNIFYVSDLAGAESVIFYMLIDYGFVYIGLIIIYYLVLISFFIKNSSKNKDILALTIPAIIALMTHLLTSRPDNSWQIFMPLIGAGLYMIQDRKIKSIRKTTSYA